MTDDEMVSGQDHPGKTSEEKEIMRHLARVLHRHDVLGRSAGGESGGSKSKFKEVRADYRRLARKIARSLEKRGVRLTLGDGDGDHG